MEEGISIKSNSNKREAESYRKSVSSLYLSSNRPIMLIEHYFERRGLHSCPKN